MEGFYLLVGHLVGDYILQNDFLAANKANQWPGPCPGSYHPVGDRMEFVPCPDRSPAWEVSHRKWMVGHIACTAHCMLYTLAVWAFSWSWMPGWGVAACFLTHWIIDRTRFAGLWMRHVSGQKAFATGPLAPWSIIVVDNTLHLLTLAAIALACSRP